ncbi:hypothetical protein ACQ9SL_004841 [Escherichia coli]|uniref:hypothetical protein n=1 Tax=Escherichia coli TaxID=562 RepID=UPI0019C74429|nr:hypothetical protein [Escherichia coli]CAD5643029.1 Abi-like protein [Escherichia coli]CAD5644226.1 Abi-like protein [Escherichia coli]
MLLEDYISPERLKVYTDVLKLKPEEALGGYNWNKALSAGMQPLLHCLEVTLRNAIDYAIRHNPPPGYGGLMLTGSTICRASSVIKPTSARVSFCYYIFDITSNSVYTTYYE